MKNFWERLTKRQQYLVMGGGAVVMVFILTQALFFPLYDAHSRARRALAANQRILKEMIPLAIEYRKGKQTVTQVEGAIAARAKDFNLFSYVEKRTGDAAIKGHVKYINPAKTAATGPYEETAVDVKLETVTLKQLVGFIYLVESPMELVKIKNISIIKNKDKMEYLNATMQIVTYVLPRGDALIGGTSTR